MGMQVTVGTAEWAQLKRDLDDFEPALARALRRKIRHSGDEAIDGIRKTLSESTPGGNAPGAGLAALAAGTRVTVSFSKRMAGARIVTSGSRLPAGHAGLLKVYNLASFRHPVFGDQSNWVAEGGRPYFTKPIKEALDRTLYPDISAALDEAIHAIGGRGR